MSVSISWVETYYASYRLAKIAYANSVSGNGSDGAPRFWGHVVSTSLDRLALLGLDSVFGCSPDDARNSDSVVGCSSSWRLAQAVNGSG